MIAELLENISPNNVLFLSETIVSLVLDPHFDCSIVKMLQTAKGTQQREDGKTRIYTWCVVDTMAGWTLSG